MREPSQNPCRRFVHNDLKPANVLLGSGAELQPKPLHLIDFGSCTRANGRRGTGCVKDIPARRVQDMSVG